MNKREDKNTALQTNILFWVGVRSEDSLLIKKHGGFKYLDISKNCWKWWCKNNDVIFLEYKNTSEPDTNAHRPTWTRWIDVFSEVDKLNIKYDKIAVVDGSSLIRWDTPNFFELVDDRLTAFRSIENLKWIYDGVDGYKSLFNNFEFDLSKYITCGFQIFTKNHRQFLDKVKDFYYANYDEIIILQTEKVRKGTDQTVYNYLLQVENIDINRNLSKQFLVTHLHRFDLLHYNWQLNEDKTPFFIKYGYIWFYSGFSNRGDRYNLMQQTWDLIGHNYE